MLDTLVDLPRAGQHRPGGGVDRSPLGRAAGAAGARTRWRPSSAATSTASPRCSSATGACWPSAASSTSTSRSTGRSRSCSPTRRPAARRALPAGCSSSTSSRTSRPAHLLLDPAAGRPRRRGVRGGRRRPDDLRLLGRRRREWLIEFGRFFPTAGEHPLEVNYRCPSASSRPPGPCSPTTAAGCTSASWRRPGRVPAAARAAGRRSARMPSPPRSTSVSAPRRRRGGDPSDVAVLTRVNASLAPVQVALCAPRGPGPAGRRRVLPVAGRGAGGAGLAPPGRRRRPTGSPAPTWRSAARGRRGRCRPRWSSG